MRPALKTALVVFYNAAVVCAAFGIAEYAARAVIHARRGTVGAQSDLLMDRWTGYRNNPSYQRTGLRHTAEGFRRDQNISLEKPPNTIRIFLMGGSVAYGAGTMYPEIDHQWRIDNNQTIDHYLEQKLNSTFPARHWEVINAAVKGYLLHQDLALILSAIQRYKPDYVILLDGQNDLANLLRAPEHFDAYRQTGLAEDFDNLTNPGSLRSLSAMGSTWLANNSVLYRELRDRTLKRIFRRSREKARATAVAKGLHWTDLAPDEQNQYRISASQLDHYTHVVRQIHRILALDGVEDIFVLQPQLLLTRKPLTGIEARLSEYHRAVVGRLFVYGYETLYPELGNRLATGAQQDGYQFLNLIGVFDGIAEQTFTDECHLTPAGNLAVSDAIFNSLESSFHDRTRAAR